MTPRTNHTTYPSRGPLHRRAFLALSGGSLVTLASAACGGSDSATTSTSTTSTSTTTAAASTATSTTTAAASSASGGLAELTVADFASLGTCVLLPEKTPGPYPLDEQFDRRDITEGYDGRPLRLGFRVVDEACAALGGAKVEIWHADGTGDYSAFTDNGGGKDEGSGSTFCRGTQTANDDGIVEFLTIVPGWYHGRAVHIHLRVHLDDRTVLTSQIFFDADQLAKILTTGVYAENGLPDTSNEQDSIAGDPAAEGTLLNLVDAMTSRGAGSLALINLGVDPNATA